MFALSITGYYFERGRGAVISVIALFACFSTPDYRLGVWEVVLFLVVTIVYYFAYRSKHLVAQAPEEEVALTSEVQKELAQG